MSGRLLLQQWIKTHPDKQKATESITELETLTESVSQSEAPRKVTKVDKARSQQLWGDIFKQPKQVIESVEPPEPVQSVNSAVEQSLDPKEEHKLEIPSFMHVFMADPGALKAIKPKVHSFFAKRNTSVVATATTVRRAAWQPMHAPYSTEHVRAPASWAQKARLSFRTKHKPSSIGQVLKPLPELQVPSVPCIPRRLLLNESQLRDVAKHQACTTEHADRIVQLNKFDLGEFESQMWSEKYAPKRCREHFSPVQTRAVRDWMAAQFKSRKQQQHEPRVRRRQTNTFVVEDDEMDMEETTDMLVVHGRTGAGKTSAVYAACASLNAFVFEVSTAIKRAGKELNSVLEGIGHNHAVHQASNVVILVDDSDVVYENESGTFWPTIIQFAATSRRPVVLTCTDVHQLALVATLNIEYIGFPVPDGVRVMDAAWCIALAEGHLLNKTQVALLVKRHAADLRRVLAELQFWCQMGIGGHPSGCDWVAKKSERPCRVISERTWFSIDGDNNDNETEKELLLDIESLSRAELSTKVQNTAISFTRAGPEETVAIPGGLVLSHWCEPILPRPRGNERQLWEVYGWAMPDGHIAAVARDIAPFVRHMIAADYRRMSALQTVLKDCTAREARLIRRAWADQGADTRHYLGLSTPNMERYLRTGFPTIDLAQQHTPVYGIENMRTSPRIQ